MDYNHERLIDGHLSLYCPVENRPLRPSTFVKGKYVPGDTAWRSKDRPWGNGKGVFNACTLCHEDKRTMGQRLHDLNERLAEES